MYHRTRPIVLSVAVATVIALGSIPANAASRISFSPLVPAAPTYTIDTTASANTCQIPDSAAHITDAYPDQTLKLAALQDSSASAQIQLDLDSQGNLLRASIVKSSGNTFFDQQALAAARGSKYAPEVRNCNSFKRAYYLNISLDNSVVWAPVGLGGAAHQLVK